MLKAGSVIVGRYRLESQIGDGGMGCVWRASQLSLQRPVAIKFLYTYGPNAELQGRRFMREAQLAAAIEHRNVVDILDFGVGDGQPFMVMSLLQGETLGERMDRDPPLSVDELVRIISLSLRGLGAVHDAGIVHRDLKPENIFLVDDPDGAYPKLLDFGISRSTISETEQPRDRRSPLTTREGVVVGTPQYMSPEQARGLKQIDARSDIYSMGVILYEALTGELPFDSENIGDLIMMIVKGKCTPLGALRPELGAPLSHLVTKAMSRNPADRFQSAIEMQQKLLDATEEHTDHGIVHGLSILPRPGRSHFPPKLEVPHMPTLIDPTGPQTVSDELLAAAEASRTTPTAPTALEGTLRSDEAERATLPTVGKRTREGELSTRPIPVAPRVEGAWHTGLGERIHAWTRALQLPPGALQRVQALQQSLLASKRLQLATAAALALAVGLVSMIAWAASSSPIEEPAAPVQAAAGLGLRPGGGVRPPPQAKAHTATAQPSPTEVDLHSPAPAGALTQHTDDLAEGNGPTTGAEPSPTGGARALDEPPPPWEMGALPHAPAAVSKTAPRMRAKPGKAARPRPKKKRRRRAKPAATKLLRDLDY